MDFYTILNNGYNEIYELAASVGIDWDAHANQITPDFSTTRAATLEKKNRGKCGIKVYSKFTKQGVEYPVINFRTFKNGTESVCWNGFHLAIGKGNRSQTDWAEVEAKRAAREAEAAAKAENERLETLSNRKRSLLEFDKAPWLDETTYQSKYLARKKLNYPICIEQFKLLSHNRLAYALYDLRTYTHDRSNLKPVGYATIGDIDGRKCRSKGSGGLSVSIVFSGSTDIAYICEGQADALTVGINTGKTVFSVAGTAQIKQAAKWLAESGLFKEIVILADNDEAGKKAAVFDADFSYSAVKPRRQKDFSDVLVHEGRKALLEQLENYFHQCGSVIQSQRYCDFKIKKNAISLLMAEKGTGKTTAIQKFISEDAKGTILVISHRRALGRQIAKDFGLKYYEDISETLGKSAYTNQSRLVISCEQIQYLDASEPYDTVIIDECEQVFAHAAMSDTVKNNRTACQHIFAICNNAKTLILSDANQESCTNYVSKNVSIISAKPINRMINTYKVRAARGDKLTIVKKQNHAFGALERSFQKSEKVIFITDSIEETKRAEKIAKMYRQNTLVLNSETIDKYSKELQNINEFVNQFDCVIYSPTLGTGFDIKEGHKFTKGIFLFHGKSITAESCSQMLARFRGLGDFIGYIGNAFDILPTSVDAVKRALIDAPAKASELELQTKVFDLDEWGRKKVDIYSQFCLATIAERNKSKNNFKGRCIQIFQDEGFEVQEDHRDLITSIDANKAFKKRKEERGQERLNAAMSLYATLSNSLNEEDAIDTPNHEKEAGSSVLEIAKHQIEGKKISKGLRAVAFANLERKAAHRLDKAELAKIENKEKSQIQFKHAALRRKLLLKIYKALGICPKTLKILDESKLTVTADSKELAAFARKYYSEIYSVFRVSLHKKDSQRTFEKLINLIGLSHDWEKIKPSEEQESKKKEYVYFLEPKSLNALKLAKWLFNGKFADALNLNFCATLLNSVERSNCQNGAEKIDENGAEKIDENGAENSNCVFLDNYKSSFSNLDLDEARAGAALGGIG